MTVNNANKIKNIVIVGGGTAGWLSAAFLSKALNYTQRDTCQITLIESSDIPTVGVGEATVPSLARSLKYLGISELDWMPKCNATFKLAIKFVNWSGIPETSEFWHPFGKLAYHQSLPLSSYWLKEKLQGKFTSFAESCFEQVHLCKANKSPKLDLWLQSHTRQIQYAYHLDAGLLATYLKEKSKKQGVKQVVDKVVDVSLDKRGFIESVTTENHGKFEADLFIDCSGFQGLLINQALQEPFISYADSLLCDRAIALSIPYENQDKYNSKSGGIEPYTTSTALSSGWAWRIPLVSRTGNGYVYASDFITQEQAEIEFRKHLGKASEKIECRHLKMRIGRTKNAWVKNCVSVGLSNGFIEPLESTGIYLIEIALSNLINYFPDKTFNQSIINNYNKVIQNHYEEIRDFIIMHYCLSNREDTQFWRTNKYHLSLPDTLKEKLDLWRVMLPSDEQFLSKLFPEYSYISILDGMNHLPEQSSPLINQQNNNIMPIFRKNFNSAIEKYPNHSDYIKSHAMLNSK
jgi:hypothetical protein